MDLRTFIKQALLDIVEGVKDAQGATPEGTVVPGGFNRSFDNVAHGVSEIQAIDFTVTVTIDEKKGRQAKLGVMSAIVGAGMASDVNNSSAQSSVLKFKIPIQMPLSGSLRQE